MQTSNPAAHVRSRVHWNSWLAALMMVLSGSLASCAEAPLPSRHETGLDPRMGIEVIKLWDSAPPGALGEDFDDVPTLTVFSPQHGRANGSSVVIVPGGAYLGLADNIEGRQVADWYAARGVTAFVLKYRLGAKYLMPVPLWDASRAMRLVRSLAPKYNLKANEVGMMGFSAGGHLTALLSTKADKGSPTAVDLVERFSDRPDFVVLGYPWISAMQPSVRPFIDSYQNIMKIPAAGQAAFAEAYTPIRFVTADVPPTFIFITTDDVTVSVQAAADYFGALVAAKVPAEFHSYAHGEHGAGLGSGDPALDTWPVLLEFWLRGRGVLP